MGKEYNLKDYLRDKAAEAFVYCGKINLGIAETQYPPGIRERILLLEIYNSGLEEYFNARKQKVPNRPRLMGLPDTCPTIDELIEMTFDELRGLSVEECIVINIAAREEHEKTGRRLKRHSRRIIEQYGNSLENAKPFAREIFGELKSMYALLRLYEKTRGDRMTQREQLKKIAKSIADEVKQTPLEEIDGLPDPIDSVEQKCFPFMAGKV